MDAKEFIKELKRMCNAQTDSCGKCPMYRTDHFCGISYIGAYLVEDKVDIVEKWSNDHPIVTNRQKLLETFGVEFCYSLVINSEWLNAEYKEPKGE